MDKEKQEVLDILSKYIDLKVSPFGKSERGVLHVEKRDPMYNGNGVVYMISFFEEGELVNNRFASYMVLMNKGDEAGFHDHGTRKEQELYVIVNGEGLYKERQGKDKVTKTIDVKKGHITSVSGLDNYHSIINTGDEPLIIFVVATNEKQ